MRSVSEKKKSLTVGWDLSTILVVEDDPSIRELLSYNFGREHFEVIEACDGTTALSLVYQLKPEIILLDLMIPGLNGIELCQKIKSDVKVRHIPVLILSAKGQETDIVYGLGIGADDYITKPFSIKELMARVYARLRNSVPESKPNFVTTSEQRPIYIDYSKHQVKVDGKPIFMTIAEFKLLSVLIKKKGEVLTRDSLLHFISGDDAYVIDRNIDVHILSIRKKLGKYRDLIKTVRGIGYSYELEN